MADDTPLGQPMDWPTAAVHLTKLVNEYRSISVLNDLIATGNDARHWLEANTQEIAGRQAEIVKLKEDTEAAKKAVQTAKRLQAAAEENARAAAAEAKAQEDQSGRAIRAAQQQQSGRLAELEQAMEGRRRILESDHAARSAQLDELIGGKQAQLSELTAAIEALRAGLPAPRKA